MIMMGNSIRQIWVKDQIDDKALKKARKKRCRVCEVMRKICDTRNK